MLSILSGLRATGFAADSVSDTLVWEPATARLEVRGPEGVDFGELIFLEREDDSGYYVRRADSPVVYTISTYTGGQILKREDELEGEG